MTTFDPMLSIPTASTFETDDDDDEENGQQSEMKIPIIVNCTNHENISNHVLITSFVHCFESKFIKSSRSKFTKCLKANFRSFYNANIHGK